MSLAALSARNWASQASASAALTGSIASSDATASTPPASLASDSLSRSPITVLRVGQPYRPPWPREHSPPVGDFRRVWLRPPASNDVAAISEATPRECLPAALRRHEHPRP